jgi:hypothetical protein
MVDASYLRDKALQEFRLARDSTDQALTKNLIEVAAENLGRADILALDRSRGEAMSVRSNEHASPIAGRDSRRIETGPIADACRLSGASADALLGSFLFATAVLADLHHQLKAFYSDIGRPSVDPELMIRMLLVGYCYGIRHERRLCQEVALHLAYRWFCKLDLDDKVPHHSTFSVNRLGRFRERCERNGGQRQPVSRQGAGRVGLDQCATTEACRGRVSGWT